MKLLVRMIQRRKLRLHSLHFQRTPPPNSRKRHASRVLPSRRASKDWFRTGTASTASKATNVYSKQLQHVRFYFSTSSASPGTSSTSNVEASSTSTSSAGSSQQAGSLQGFSKRPIWKSYCSKPAGPAGDLAKVGAPTPKGPPASFMPAPREVLAPQPMDTCAATAALPGQDIPMAHGQKPKIRYVKSPSDIDWGSSLKDQLEPQLSGGPDPKKSFEELCMIRNRIPKMDDQGFQAIIPSKEQCIICVVHKNGSRHFIHLSEAAAWIINAAHWLSYGVEIGMKRPNSNT